MKKKKQRERETIIKTKSCSSPQPPCMCLSQVSTISVNGHSIPWATRGDLRVHSLCCPHSPTSIISKSSKYYFWNGSQLHLQLPVLESNSWSHPLFPTWTVHLCPLSAYGPFSTGGQRDPWTCMSVKALLHSQLPLSSITKSKLPSTVYKVLSDLHSLPQLSASRAALPAIAPLIIAHLDIS